MKDCADDRYGVLIDNAQLEIPERRALAEFLCRADIGKLCTLCGKAITESDCLTTICAGQGKVAHHSCWIRHTVKE